MSEGTYYLLYDGHCRFCEHGSRQLVAWMRRGSVERIDFQQPGSLDRFAGLTHEQCMKEMKLVTPQGRTYGGMEAIVRALTTHRWLGWIVLAYYLPGLRWLLDRLYRRVAANRYRILGKTLAAGGCEGGTCHLHLPDELAHEHQPPARA